MKKVKVLFLIPNLMHGGAERVLVNLVNHMDANRFNITVQTMFDAGIYKDKLNSDIRYKGGFFWYFPGNTKVFKLFSPERLFRHYIKDDYDIIVSYLEGPSARVVGGCPKNSRAKLVCWIHVEQGTFSRAKYVFRSGKEAERCYKRFDKTVCVSETVKKDFSSLFPYCAEPEVLYNTVESKIISEKSSEEITDLSFSADKINLISVAKLQYVKGYDRLIEALKTLRENRPEIPFHLFLVGIGEEKENLEKLAQRLGLANCITFAGFKENPYKYVKAADLYVCSSRREGFSTAVTESLIVGTPVLSTDCSGAAELLGKNGEYGLIVENSTQGLYSGLEYLLTDRCFEKYIDKAKERGGAFNTESTVNAVQDLFEELIKK
ncbi:MAG: glycosyltransferase [Clostridiales bacterium]|nr:glycosyltransferase [Clostridiales bacterium]